jgi:hypothetical protein
MIPPEPAGQRELTTRHHAGIRLADDSRNGVNAAGAGAPASVDGGPVNGVVSSQGSGGAQGRQQEWQFQIGD